MSKICYVESGSCGTRNPFECHLIDFGYGALILRQHLAISTDATSSLRISSDNDIPYSVDAHEVHSLSNILNLMNHKLSVAQDFRVSL